MDFTRNDMKNKIILLMLLTLISFNSNSSEIKSDKKLVDIPYSNKPMARHFKSNCEAITKNFNIFSGYKATTCKAVKNVILIKLTNETINRKEAGSMALVIGAIGWAVNEDYFDKSDWFVFGNNKFGCNIVQGYVAAYAQDEVKKNKKSLDQFMYVLAGAKNVKCPDYLIE